MAKARTLPSRDERQGAASYRFVSGNQTPQLRTEGPGKQSPKYKEVSRHPLYDAKSPQPVTAQRCVGVTVTGCSSRNSSNVSLGTFTARPRVKISAPAPAAPPPPAPIAAPVPPPATPPMIAPMTAPPPTFLAVSPPRPLPFMVYSPLTTGNSRPSMMMRESSNCSSELPDNPRASLV